MARPPNPLPPVPDLVERYRGGWTLPALAAYAKTQQRYVRAALVAAGVEIRGRGQRATQTATGKVEA